MGVENNNYNKEINSRPAILEVILNEYGQKPISFLELLGDGTGAEFYSTWLNIKMLNIVERDKDKYLAWSKKVDKFEEDYNAFVLTYGEDLNVYFKNRIKRIHDVINLDFCTFLYDNGKDNCTATVIDNMFKYNAIKDGGLVFFTFMVAGIGVNFHKRDAIIERDDIADTIQCLAFENGYKVEEVLYYKYCSGHPTWMANYGIKVKEL